MKMRSSEHVFSLVISLVFSTALLLHFFWLELQSDFPHTDEYQSLLAALGFPVYSPTLYVKWLEIFTAFFSEFQSLARFNFIASGFFLSLMFNVYHARRGVTQATNLVMTAILALSTIQIALTRKMHFWAAGFFFLLLVLSDFFKKRSKDFFLFFGLIVLGFFRVEFFFSAVVACTILAGKKVNSKWRATVFISGTVVVFAFILIFGYGMKDLLMESYHLEKGISVLTLARTAAILFFKNVGLHVFYSVSSLLVPLSLYFPTLALAFAFLFASAPDVKENAKKMLSVFKKEWLPFYLPALLVLLSIRFMDFYVIMTFVIFLSMLNFLLSGTRNLLAALSVAVLLIIAVFYHRPQFQESSYINLPTMKRNGTIHRRMFSLIENLEVKLGALPYKILFNQYVKGVLPFEGREYYQFSDLKQLCGREKPVFDIVLLPGKWVIVPEQILIENCVRPSLLQLKRLDWAPGFELYVSARVFERINQEN